MSSSPGFAASFFFCTFAFPSAALTGDWLESDCETLLTVAGTTPQDSFAWRVLALGDVTGDGVTDLVASAPLSAEGASAGGKVTLFSGADGSAVWTRFETVASSILGYELALADWNGDGTPDVLAAAPFAGGIGGRVWVFEGRTGSTLAVLSPGIANAGFGASLVTGGDFDGDGVEDVAIGSIGYDQASVPNAGRVYVYQVGSGALVSVIEAPVLAAGDEEFGIALAFLGDASIVLDGADELVVGYRDASFWSGGALVYSHGSPAPVLDSAVAPVPMDFNLAGNTFDGGLDADGDGRGDFVAGSGANGVLELRSGLDGSLIRSFDGNGEGGNFGAGRLIPDVDGDARADVLAGARTHDGGAQDAGKVFLYSGRTGALLRTMTSTLASRRLGRELRAVGDFDGDGAPDYAVAGTGGGTSGPPPGSFVVVRGEPAFPSYCASLPNSTGAAARISASGSASVARADLVLHADHVPNGFGLFFHGAHATQVPFGNGFRCASGDVQRGAVVHVSGGGASYVYDGSDARHSLAAYVDATRRFQFWFRDPAAGGALFDTSDALAVNVAP